MFLNLWRGVVFWLAPRVFRSRMNKESFIYTVEELSRFQFSNFHRLVLKFVRFKIYTYSQKLLVIGYVHFFWKIYSTYLKNIQRKPQVTVGLVVVTHGINPYLIQTLDSVADQTELPSEVVLVISGSSYQVKITQKAVEETRLKNFQVVVVEDNQVGKNRNIGAAILNTTHLIFLDGDDVLKKKAIEIYRIHAEVHGDQIVASSCVLFPEISYYHLLPKITHSSLGRYNQLNVTTLVSKRLFDNMKGFRDSNIPFEHQPEDWDFWFRLTKIYGSIIAIQDILYLYRQHGNSTTSQENQYRKEKEDYWRYVVTTSESIYWVNNYTSHPSDTYASSEFQEFKQLSSVPVHIYADNLLDAQAMMKDNIEANQFVQLIILKDDIVKIDEFERNNQNVAVFSLFDSFIGTKTKINFLQQKIEKKSLIFIHENSSLEKILKKLN
jgi:glycosyltransferase involved in cell wall biosynthesis